jgi:hypothetical protein
MNEPAAPEDPNNGTARGAGAPFHTEVRDTHDPLDGLGFNPFGSGPLPIRSRELDADGRTFDITAEGRRTDLAAKQHGLEVVWLWLYS